MSDEAFADCPACRGSGVDPAVGADSGTENQVGSTPCTYCFGAGYVFTEWAEAYEDERVDCLWCGGTGYVNNMMWSGLCVGCNGRKQLPLSIAIQAFGAKDADDYRHFLTDRYGGDFEPGITYASIAEFQKVFRDTPDAFVTDFDAAYCLPRREARPGVDWSAIDLAGVDLSEVDLSRSLFVSARLDRANLTGADLRDSDFGGDGWEGETEDDDDVSEEEDDEYEEDSETRVPPLTWDSVKYAAQPEFGEEGTDKYWLFRGVGLRTSLQEANLSGANLSGANLRDVDLTGAILTDAILSGANLQGAVLRGVNLSRADCTDVVLDAADLREANLTGTNIETASSMDGARLLSAAGLSADQIDLCFAKSAFVEKIVDFESDEALRSLASESTITWVSDVPDSVIERWIVTRSPVGRPKAVELTAPERLVGWSELDTDTSTITPAGGFARRIWLDPDFYDFPLWEQSEVRARSRPPLPVATLVVEQLTAPGSNEPHDPGRLDDPERWRVVSGNGPKLVWTLATHQRPTNKPYPGVIFLSSSEPRAEGRITRLDPTTGKIAWSVLDAGPTHPPTPFLQTVDHDRVFLTASDGTLRALDASSGQEQWRHVADPFARAWCLTQLVLAVTPDHVKALEPVTGDVLWQVDNLGMVETVWERPSLEGLVFLLGRDYIRAIDVQSGQEKWHRTLGGALEAVGADTACIRPGRGELRLVDLGSGQDLGRDGSAGDYESPWGDTARFARDMWGIRRRGAIVGVDASSAQERWSISGEDGLRPDRLLHGEDAFYVRTHDGLLVALEPATGKPRWIFDGLRGLPDAPLDTRAKWEIHVARGVTYVHEPHLRLGRFNTAGREWLCAVDSDSGVARWKIDLRRSTFYPLDERFLLQDAKTLQMLKE